MGSILKWVSITGSSFYIEKKSDQKVCIFKMGFENVVKIQKTLAISFNRKQTFETTKTTQISWKLVHLETKLKGFHNTDKTAT